MDSKQWKLKNWRQRGAMVFVEDGGVRPAAFVFADVAGITLVKPSYADPQGRRVAGNTSS
jgi:hypothetical protein